ncbi:MAG TPA: hypothetical protein VIL26_01065 [Clostridia bacterium]
MIDFHKLYHEFINEWIEKNSSNYVTEDEIEDAVSILYEEWCNHPYKELDGLTPKEYFSKIEDPKTLVDMFVGYSAGGDDIPTLLLDRICEVRGTIPFLMDILKREKSDELTMYAVNLLNEMQCVEPFDIYLNWIFDSKQDKDLRDLASEVLAESAEAVKDKVLAKLDGADFSSKEYASDILVHCSHDERIFTLLKEMFLSKTNIQLYANYLGQYGDERAIEILTEEAKTCNYICFIEIRNAIEELGGELNIERDFSQDKDFQKIKNIKLS